MHRVRKPEFKRQHPELHGQQLEQEWKKFKKNQEIYLFNEYHGLTNDHPLDKVTGFKSKKKNEYLAIEPKHRKIIPGDYKLKDNKKRFICHLFYPDGTYFMDIMFTGDLSYLLFLDFHTRYLYIEPVENKTPHQVYLALMNIIEKNQLQDKVKVIRGDGEKAFVSHQVEHWLAQRNIHFKSVKRTEIYPGFKLLNHDKLGVIDRVTRTLRDQAYVAGYGDPLPENVLRHLVDVYNRAPHHFLSKYLGHEISLSEMDEEKKLMVWRKVQQHNFNVTKHHGFYIKPGRKVAIYNDDHVHKRRQQVRPQEYTILGYRHGGYDVQDQHGNITNISRYRMKLLPED